MRITRILFSLAIAAASTPAMAADNTDKTQARTPVTMYADSSAGNDYAAAYGLCQAINTTDSGLKCELKVTGATRKSLDSLNKEKNSFSFTNTNALLDLSNADNPVASNYSDLRQLSTLMPSVLVLVASEQSGIRRLADLKDKTVSMGPSESGTADTVNAVIESEGLKPGELFKTKDLKISELSRALCSNKIDAFFYMNSQPDAIIQNPTTACDAKLVPLTGDGIDRFIGKNHGFHKVAIPGGLYPGNPKDIPGLSTPRLLVTSKNTDPEVASKVIGTLYESFAQISKDNRALSFFQIEGLNPDTRLLPIHPGADQYYQDNAIAP